MTTRQVLLLALVVVVTAGALHDNGGAVVVVGLAALWFLWWHRRHPVPPAGPSEAMTVAVPPAAASPGDVQDPASGPESITAQTAVLPPYAAPVWTPPAPRPRSILTPLTLSAAALAVGALLLVAAAGSVSVPTEVVLGVALGVVGLGLVASAFWGRARGLVPIAFLLAIALAGTFGARPAIDHGVGKRHWVAQTTGADYRLGIGDATLVVGGLLTHGDAAKELTAQVTVGHLVIEVPQGVHAIVDAHVQNGDIQGPGGVDKDGRHVTKGFELGPQGLPPVYVHARVKLGMVEVRNA
jgi:hypothetical protein